MPTYIFPYICISVSIDCLVCCHSFKRERNTITTYIYIRYIRSQSARCNKKHKFTEQGGSPPAPTLLKRVHSDTSSEGSTAPHTKSHWEENISPTDSQKHGARHKTGVIPQTDTELRVSGLNLQARKLVAQSLTETGESGKALPRVSTLPRTRPDMHEQSRSERPQSEQHARLILL